MKFLIAIAMTVVGSQSYADVKNCAITVDGRTTVRSAAEVFFEDKSYGRDGLGGIQNFVFHQVTKVGHLWKVEVRTFDRSLYSETLNTAPMWSANNAYSSATRYLETSKSFPEAFSISVEAPNKSIATISCE